ncbi:hypothetical protein C0991_002362 [Blastosporella zonata]|nr:hypothetical protein C0991_002362 [Blastosporella zonata]
MNNFEDRAVSSWCAANEETFEALLTSDFIAKVCERWLSTSWFIEYGKILLKPQNNAIFLEGVAQMCDTNLILKSKPDIHLDNKHLRNNICILMNDDLVMEYNTANGDPPGKLDSIKELNKWIALVMHLDDNIHAKHDREHRQYLAHLMNFKKDTRKTANVTTSANDTTTPTVFKRNYALKLKDEERALEQWL